MKRVLVGWLHSDFDFGWQIYPNRLLKFRTIGICDKEYGEFNKKVRITIEELTKVKEK